MNASRFFYLIWKHRLFLLALPLGLILLVMLLTMNQPKTWVSKSVLYTGFASGFSIESMNNSRIDYLAADNAFDNLINIVKSRKTLEEVALRLLAQHLSLQKDSPQQISKTNHDRLLASAPQDVRRLVVVDAEQTVLNLYLYRQSSPYNYINNLLNSQHPHYSTAALAQVTALRLGASDLLQLSYECNDPGICQQTLMMMGQVVTRNYRATRESMSGDVVSYFEEQVRLAAENLRNNEERYATFNKNHKIINYYEETKSIAIHRDNFNATLQDTKMKFAAALAALAHLESKMESADRIFLQSQEIIGKRKQLSDITAQIATQEMVDSSKTRKQDITPLFKRAQSLKETLKSDLNRLHEFGKTPDNLPIAEVLNRWLENAIIADENRARLHVLENYKSEFDKYYETFSPLGSQIKRFEREIGVRENEYLELLHSLSLAKLKQQNIEITNTLKIVDEPFFPVHPNSFHSLKLFMLVFVAGLVLGLAIILMLEFMDESICTPARARQLTNVDVTAVVPKLAREAGEENPHFQKAVDFLAQQVAWMQSNTGPHLDGPTTLLVLSTRAQEGKTLVCNKIKTGLEKRGLLVQYHDITALLDRSAVLQPAAKAASAARMFPSPLDWLQKEHQEALACDVLIMEIPDISVHPFPVAWLKQFQHALLVVRANRTWKESDRVALENIQKQMLADMQCVLNGVDDFEIQLWLGVEAIRKNRLFVQRPLWMPKRAVSLHRA